MLYMVIFLYIATVTILVFVGLVLLKGYIIMEDYKKKLENSTIQQIQNNSINNHNKQVLTQKQNLPTPKIILDKKVYSQQQFSKEINSGNFQISPMLQSKLYGKDW